MKVYMLTSGCHSDRSNDGVFSSLEALEAGKKILGGTDYNEPEEWEVDEILGNTVGPVAWVDISCETGEIREVSRSEYQALRHPGRCEVHLLKPGREWVIMVKSPRSIDHAIKVAVEKRQEWLRTRAINPAESREVFEIEPEKGGG